jgi:hypothetical protein
MAMSAAAASLPTRRRWLSFTLRGLLLAFTALALGLGWYANRARRQQAAVAVILSRCPRHDGQLQRRSLHLLFPLPGTLTERVWLRGRRGYKLQPLTPALSPEYRGEGDGHRREWL